MQFAILRKKWVLFLFPVTKNLSVCYDIWVAHKFLFIELIYQMQF